MLCLQGLINSISNNLENVQFETANRKHLYILISVLDIVNPEPSVIIIWTGVP